MAFNIGLKMLGITPGYILVGLLGFFCLSASHAEEQVATAIDDTVEQVSELTFAPVAQDVLSSVEDQIRAFLNSPEMAPLVEKADKGNAYLGFAVEEVAVGPKDRTWAKHRVLAYERALVEAENNFVVSQALKLKGETVRELFKDGSGEIPAFDDSDLVSANGSVRIFKKLQAAIEGRLDKTLEELGVDPSDYQAAPEKQRTDMLSDSLRKEATKKSIANLSGLMTFRTFEGVGEGGSHAIGVVVVQSPSLKHLAHEVLTARGAIEPRKKRGLPLNEQVSGEKEGLLKEFGVRRVIDERGYPAIVSFGQWANSVVTDNDRVRRKYRSLAQKQARNLADQNIAYFLSSTSNFTNESEVGDAVEHYFETDSTGFVEEQYSLSILDKIRESSRTRTNIKIIGLRDLFQWTMKHPQYGHEIVGVVRVWSPATERASRELRKNKPQSKVVKKEEKSVPPVKEEMQAPVVKKSKGYMSADDI